MKRHKLLMKQLVIFIFMGAILREVTFSASSQILDHYTYLPVIATTPSIDQILHHHIYLPVVMNPFVSIGPPYDMVQFMAGETSGNGILYEVQHSDGSQVRYQTQIEPYRFFHTKGSELSAEWEELWYTNQYIYRGTDTSPGNDLYYTLRDNGLYGSKWAPRYWNVGDVYERSPEVTFYRKEDCAPQFGGVQRTWLRFEAYYSRYTFPSNITLYNVVQFAWLLNPADPPVERYFYAQGYGLVQWESSDGRGTSYISEIHAPGARPNNTREVLPCLDTSGISPAGLPKPFLYAK